MERKILHHRVRSTIYIRRNSDFAKSCKYNSSCFKSFRFPSANTILSTYLRDNDFYFRRNRSFLNIYLILLTQKYKVLFSRHCFTMIGKINEQNLKIRHDAYDLSRRHSFCFPWYRTIYRVHSIVSFVVCCGGIEVLLL